MANRSYLYVVDAIPGEGPGPRPRALAEWRWDVPDAYRVLLSPAPRAVPSTIWGPPVRAILGDYDKGLAAFERYLAALPQTDDVRGWSAAALAVLRDPQRRGRHLLLEVGEILEVTAVPDADGEVGEAELAEAFDRELAEIGDPAAWIAAAPRVTEDQLGQATGAGAWPSVLYQEPGPVQGTPAAPPPSAVPPPPVHAVAPPTPPAPTGAPWLMGLLALVPIPGLSAVASGIVMAAVGRGQRRRGEVDAENGRRAANWGLTYALLTVLLVAGHVVLLLTLTREAPVQGFFPLGTVITIWFVLSLVHLVISVVGSLRAGAGRVFPVPAIPFFRD